MSDPARGHQVAGRLRRSRRSAIGCTAVMASGIVSLDLRSGRWEIASAALLVLAAAAWIWVVVRGELSAELAGVPATAVLGTRLAALGWTAVAWALLALAAALSVAWLRRFRARPARSRSGSEFLPTVAVQSLAVLSATLADATAQAWLRIVGLGLCAGGIVLYVRTLVRFDLRELLRGRGDQWVAGGALAISAFAYAKLHSHLLPLRVASIALWAAAAAWLPALVAGELLRPRLSGAPERWSTVFPLGMYAAMSFAVTALAGMHWMRVFARSWTWVAAAVWALVLIDAVARGRSA